MKRCAIIFASALLVVLLAPQANAQTIDLISQTYHIGGVLAGVPVPPNSFDITTSTPNPSPPPFAAGLYIVSNGGASGSSLFAQVADGDDNLMGGASADFVFRLIGGSDMVLSYTLNTYAGGTRTASVTLSDLTTGGTLVSAIRGMQGGVLNGAVDVPVVPSDVYALSAVCQGSFDPASVSVTLSAVPEPATTFLVGLGLIGVAGVRRKFR